ncbi:MAG: rRNA maturation RNase YbeY [Paracoccaceae bacterium]|nr:rRNA maturation RNase YbeY [Paracoccaceae bacterium]MDG1738836.1 rRNA maturation RNase YbeY [Paracoccaceae bacterium]MDG2259720.1 rRNA maturation RNase YbeY [Paracoccaceae bacterium]
MAVDTITEDTRWDAAGLEALAETASIATLRHLGHEPDAFEIALLGCDDARITALNEDFREKPAATNVLSWPSSVRSALIDGDPPMPPALPYDEELGDIAISYDTCQREADEAGKTFSDHVTHLVIHGILHLLGYDHIRDADATLMERIEVEILGKMGIGDPYNETGALDASHGQD